MAVTTQQGLRGRSAIVTGYRLPVTVALCFPTSEYTYQVQTEEMVRMYSPRICFRIIILTPKCPMDFFGQPPKRRIRSFLDPCTLLTYNFGMKHEVLPPVRILYLQSGRWRVGFHVRTSWRIKSVSNDIIRPARLTSQEQTGTRKVHSRTARSLLFTMINRNRVTQRTNKISPCVYYVWRSWDNDFVHEKYYGLGLERLGKIEMATLKRSSPSCWTVILQLSFIWKGVSPCFRLLWPTVTVKHKSEHSSNA